MTTIVNIVAAALLLTGGGLAVLAAIGLLRFETAYARFHATGKASPVAFLVTAIGAAMTLGPAGAAQIAVAATAMILTLPVGVHLLFRAVHRTTATQLSVDELAPAEQAASRATRQPSGE
jgi:multicomponent Na+:H+ antiporter subunit G